MKLSWGHPSSIVISGILVGIPAGAAAIFIFVLVSNGFRFVYEYLISLSIWQFGLFSLALILFATRLASWLTTQWAPLSSGSGVSQMKLIYWRDQGHIPIKATFAKFFASVVGLISGIGLGRRGPSVFICAGNASAFAVLFRLPKKKKKNACAAGAAAGLAACFNTPLAAVTFFLEEVLGDLNSRRLGIVLLAAIIGAGTYHLIIGNFAIYPLVDIKNFDLKWYIPAVITGIGSSLIGIAFIFCIKAIIRQSKSFAAKPYWLYPIIGAFGGWAICFLVFAFFKTTGLFGTGDPELNRIFNGELSVSIVWILLVCKFLSVCLYYGTGGCGGIFGPLIFLGGASGYAIGATINIFFDIGPHGPVAMAALGMCACFGCVVKAPITGILMLFEMTHSFEILPPLMLVTLISQSISKKFNSLSIYDSLLILSGNDLERHIPPRDFDQWLRKPTATLANLNPKYLDSIIPEDIEEFLKSAHYDTYPVVENGVPIGVTTIDELRRSLKENRSPELSHPITVYPATPISETQQKLLQSKSNIALVVDSKKGKLLGILSLRDILRAELNRSH